MRFPRRFVRPLEAMQTLLQSDYCRYSALGRQPQSDCTPRLLLMTTSPTTQLRTGPGRLWLSFGSPRGTEVGLSAILTFTLSRTSAKSYPIPAPSKKKELSEMVNIFLALPPSTQIKPIKTKTQFKVCNQKSLFGLSTISESSLICFYVFSAWRPYSKYRTFF